MVCALKECPCLRVGEMGWYRGNDKSRPCKARLLFYIGGSGYV